VIEARSVRGARTRIDFASTARSVSTNVYYPTDSTLVRDGVRVLTRARHRAGAALGDARAGLGGCAHTSDKVTPNEFAKLVTIHESEHQIITTYEVHATRPADGRHLVDGGAAPASDDVRARRRPRGRRSGFNWATNERAATDREVRRVILSWPGRSSPPDGPMNVNGGSATVGSEGRITVLKRRHGLDRCLYHAEEGMHR
jgi:hypothetical protein